MPAGLRLINGELFYVLYAPQVFPVSNRSIVMCANEYRDSENIVRIMVDLEIIEDRVIAKTKIFPSYRINRADTIRNQAKDFIAEIERHLEHRKQTISNLANNQPCTTEF